ncbi:MAG: glycosyltransferase family 4 protein [Akkermansiaceae bacterium]|nr:glycosyltransferase family 4 protein [Akkermansiaceae bacterium]
MKVMHLLPSLSSGGVEQVVLELCQGLTEQGVECIVVSAGGPMVSAIEATGARHITRPIGKKSIFTLFQIGKLARLIKEEKPDILHLHSRVPAWVGHLAVKRIRKSMRPKVVSTFHGFHSVNFYSGIMAKGDKVIAVSRCMKQHILDNYPRTPAESIVVIPNSVDVSQNYPEYKPTAEWYEKWHADYPELAGKYTICLPGRITRLKGATHLPPIISELKAKGIPAHAVIVGETKKGKEAIRHEIEQAFETAGLSQDVTWTGHRRDLRNVLCACNVTISLTLQPESFGKTTLEALALGRPVAGYEHGGVGEQLEVFLPEGMVTTGDTSAMAKVLGKWYTESPSPKLPVPAPYRREDMIGAHLELYRSLLS